MRISTFAALLLPALLAPCARWFAPKPISSTPASAGGTAGAATNPTRAYRLRMIGGTTQDVVQAGEPFAVGERVRLNSEGRLVRP